jgi:hypothetical protein
VDFNQLKKKAKQLVDERGGAESLKADAKELKEIAKRKGTLADKAKAAAEAIKKPGPHGPGEAGPAGEAPPPPGPAQH